MMVTVVFGTHVETACEVELQLLDFWYVYAKMLILCPLSMFTF